MKQRTVDAARGRWVGILSAIGIDESHLRNKHGPCPVCGGKDRFRFDDKDGNGTWFCSHCGSGRGIELVMLLKGCQFKDACAMIDPLIGKSAMHTSRQRKDPVPLLIRIKSQSTREYREVRRYLESRGLEVPPGVLEHGGMTYYSDGSVIGKYAAMIAPMICAGGELASIHVTYLHGGAKASVDSPKKMMPPAIKLAGSCVRLYRRDDTGVIAIAEGIESAIAYKVLTGVPTWAATNATLLAQWKPPEGITRVVVAGDNDASFAGQEAAYMLARRLKSDGLDVNVDIPAVTDTDWCDVLAETKRLEQ